MSESTKKPEQAEENKAETAPAEDTKKAEKKASKSSKKNAQADRIAELERSSKKLSSQLRRVPTTSCASLRNMITSASVRCARRTT